MTFSALRSSFGMIPRRAIRNGLALPVLETFTHINVTSASASQIVTKPSGTVEGDFLLLIAVTKIGALTPPGDAVPWNAIQGETTDNAHIHVSGWQKFAGGSEPSDYTFTLSSSSEGGWFLGRFSGVNTSDPINTRSFRKRDTADGGNSDQSMKFTAITTNITNCLLLHAAGCAGFFAFSEPTYTNGPAAATTHIADGSVTGTNGMVHLIATEPLVAAGGTGTRQWTGNNSTAGFNGRINQLIALTPLEGPPDKLEFEATTDNLLFEDGSGVLLLE